VHSKAGLKLSDEQIKEIARLLAPNIPLMVKSLKKIKKKKN
tara:strand:+ start:392 stop:514 length:123 start_codon:yes stop_codon:yes gene_type:complete